MKRKIVISITIISLISIIAIILLFTFKRVFISRLTDLDYKGKQEEYIKGITSENSTSESLMDDSSGTEYKTAESEILLHWRYYSCPSCESYTKGTTNLSNDGYNIDFYEEGDTLKTKVDSDALNYILQDAVSKSEPEWYNELKDAYNVRIENNLMWVDVTYPKDKKLDWMSVLDGSSLLFTLHNGEDDFIKFDSLVLWGEVYDIGKDTEMSEAVDTINAGANEFLDSLELQIGHDFYKMNRAESFETYLELEFVKI